MALRSGRIICRMLPLAVIFLIGGCASVNGIYNVRSYGATGDGKTLDTDAVNDAITAANSAGAARFSFRPGHIAVIPFILKAT